MSANRSNEFAYAPITRAIMESMDSLMTELTIDRAMIMQTLTYGLLGEIEDEHRHPEFCVSQNVPDDYVPKTGEVVAKASTMKHVGRRIQDLIQSIIEQKVRGADLDTLKLSEIGTMHVEEMLVLERLLIQIASRSTYFKERCKALLGVKLMRHSIFAMEERRLKNAREGTRASDNGESQDDELYAEGRSTFALMDREPNPHATTENLRSEREIAERSLIRILHVQLFRIAAMEILRMNFYGIRDTKTFDFSTVRVKSDMDGLSFSTNGLGLNEKDMKSLNTQTFSGRSPYGMTSCKIVVPSSTATMPKEIAQGFHSFLCRESSTMLTHKMSTASTELGHYADYLINGRFSEPFEVADSLGFHAGVEGDPVIKRASESIASTDELFRLIDIAIETADDVELSITSKIDGETTDVEDGILALLGASIKGSICTLLEHRRGDHKVIAADVRDLLSKNDFRFAGINRLDHIAYSIFKDMKEEFCDGNINEDDNADSSDNERDKRINDRSDTKERQRKVKKRQKAEKKRHRKLRKR